MDREIKFGSSFLVEFFQDLQNAENTDQNKTTLYFDPIYGLACIRHKQTINEAGNHPIIQQRIIFTKKKDGF